MSHGSTWGKKETKFLIEIWSDNIMKSQLEKTQKNGDTNVRHMSINIQYWDTQPMYNCNVKAKPTRSSVYYVAKTLTLVRTFRCESARSQCTTRWQQEISLVWQSSFDYHGVVATSPLSGHRIDGRLPDTALTSTHFASLRNSLSWGDDITQSPLPKWDTSS